MKRAAPMKAAPAAKKPKVDPNAKNIGRVVDALQDKTFTHDTIDMSVRELLASCGAAALETVAEERHQFQTRMVEMVEDALNGMRSNLQKTMDEQNTFASNTDNVKSQHEEDLAAAQEARDAKQTEIAEKTETRNNASDALGNASEAAAKAAEAAVKADSAKEDTAMAKQAALDLYKECFMPLKDTPEIDGGGTLLRRLEKEMEGMDVVDESLQKAAPNALVKAVKDRGQFDNIALDSLKKIFLQFDSDSAYTIENADALAAQARKKSDELKAAQEVAENVKNVAQEALTQAKKELTEIQKTIKEHEKALKGHDKRVAEIDKDKLEAEAALECFDLYVVAPFTESKDRHAPLPEPAEEQPAEEEPDEAEQREEEAEGELVADGAAVEPAGEE